MGSEVKKVDGVRIKVQSFKDDWWVYEQIGGSVEIRGTEEHRKWYCAWLCTERKEKVASLIRIENTYFTSKGAPPGEVRSARTDRAQCSDTSNCEQKHWGVGIGVTVSEKGDVDPNAGPDTVKLAGVKSEFEVSVHGTTHLFTTTAGSVPDYVNA